MAEMRSDKHEPNLLDFPPRNVWREVYQGRWRELPNVQKIEFVIELAFCLMFIGRLTYFDYVRNGNLIAFALDFGTVGIALGGFFWLLRRNVR